jgi:hypothetical protein
VAWLIFALVGKVAATCRARGREREDLSVVT